MLRFFVLLMRMKLPQLSRYLERSLATSCDLAPSHDPSALIPTGYEQPQPPPATSCNQSPSHGSKGQDVHQPALEES